MQPKPAPRSKVNAKKVKPFCNKQIDDSKFTKFQVLPDLPNVPSNLPDVPSDNTQNAPDDSEIDFDDLTRRFEELKKRH